MKKHYLFIIIAVFLLAGASALGKSTSYITKIDYRSPRTTYAVQTSDVPM